MLEEMEQEATAIEKLRKLVQGETKLNIRNDDMVLLRFLNYADFNIERALVKMKEYYERKAKYPDWFAESMYTDVQKSVLAMKVHCILKERDQFGRRIYILKLGNVITTDIKAWELFQVDDLWLEAATDEIDTQRNGLVYIFDMKNISWRCLSFFTPGNCRIASDKAEGIPIRKMEYHVVNSGPVVNTLISIVFPFLSGATKENIHFHKSNWPSLHKFVSPEYLPVEYGGKIEIDYEESQSYLSTNESRIKVLTPIRSSGPQIKSLYFLQRMFYDQQ